mmetsp:Transcript_4150/g.9750  ORF Transcript_4150/g.9750 Transcript_4150/m.9750 type:complete len:231 (+) Transcript_4150:710-1402(+)
MEGGAHQLLYRPLHEDLLLHRPPVCGWGLVGDEVDGLYGWGRIPGPPSVQADHHSTYSVGHQRRQGEAVEDAVVHADDTDDWYDHLHGCRVWRFQRRSEAEAGCWFPRDFLRLDEGPDLLLRRRRDGQGAKAVQGLTTLRPAESDVLFLGCVLADFGCYLRTESSHFVLCILPRVECSNMASRAVFFREDRPDHDASQGSGLYHENYRGGGGCSGHLCFPSFLALLRQGV